MDAAMSLPASTVATSADPASAPAGNIAAAHKAAQDFEGFFLSQVFENMFAGISADPIFGGGNGETIYRSLLLQQYSKVAAQRGGIGISDAVQREMLRAQEGK